MRRNGLSDAEAQRLFGQAVRARRTQLGLTQPQAAMAAGCGQSTWSRIEHGTAPSLLATLTKVASALETPPWLLMAQAFGQPEDRRIAERFQVIRSQSPGRWLTIKALMEPGIADVMLSR